MEESKYYTPTIEEFHIGFEYEWLNENSDWIKEDSPEEISKEGFDEQTFGLRVKYLDREDIESLGWRFEKQHPGLEQLQFTMDLDNILDDLSLDYDLDSHYLRIAWYGDGDITRFSGKIKNKSELKKLMQQLGI